MSMNKSKTNAMILFDSIIELSNAKRGSQEDADFRQEMAELSSDIALDLCNIDGLIEDEERKKLLELSNIMQLLIESEIHPSNVPNKTLYESLRINVNPFNDAEIEKNLKQVKNKRRQLQMIWLSLAQDVYGSMLGITNIEDNNCDNCYAHVIFHESLDSFVDESTPFTLRRLANGCDAVYKKLKEPVIMEAANSFREYANVLEKDSTINDDDISMIAKTSAFFYSCVVYHLAFAIIHQTITLKDAALISTIDESVLQDISTRKEMIASVTTTQPDDSNIIKLHEPKKK